MGINTMEKINFIKGTDPKKER